MGRVLMVVPVGPSHDPVDVELVTVPDHLGQEQPLPGQAFGQVPDRMQADRRLCQVLFGWVESAQHPVPLQDLHAKGRVVHALGVSIGSVGGELLEPTHVMQ